ncbi:MAG: hypothetical protein RL701_4953 [Pseudomonadota bacterium]
MVKLKALNVVQARDYILERVGPAGVERIRAAMDPAAAEHVYSPTLLATDWIEVAYAVEHSRAYDRMFPLGAPWKTAERMVSDLVIAHYKGTYRSVFLNATTPMQMLEKSARLWNRFYDAGETQLVVNSPSSVTKFIVGVQDMPRDHEYLIMPYYEELLRQSGAISVTARHVKCAALGAECCETVIQWRDLDRS